MYSEHSVLLTYFLWQKSLMWFLKRSLNEVYAIPKYFLLGLLGADTTALYTVFAVSIIKIFKDNGLSVTVTSNITSADFLDLILNWKNESYQPFRKPNNDPIIIDINSNHPPQIFKQLPKSIFKILAENSLSKEVFDKSKMLYDSP